MNRGFKYYYSKARKDTKIILKKKKNVFKTIAFFFSQLIGMFILPSSNIFSRYQFVKSIDEQKELSLISSYIGGDDKNKFFNMVYTNIIKLFLMVLILIIPIVFIFLGQFLNNYLLNVYGNVYNLNIIFIIITIVSIIPLLISLYFILFYFNSFTFVCFEKNLVPSLNIKKGINMMKKGKFTLFLFYLIPLLILIIPILIGYGGYLLLNLTVINGIFIDEVFIYGVPVLYILLGIITLIFLPRFLLPTLISSYLLKKDLLEEDKDIVIGVNTNLDKHFKTLSSKEKVEALFDENKDINTKLKESD